MKDFIYLKQENSKSLIPLISYLKFLRSARLSYSTFDLYNTQYIALNIQDKSYMFAI